MDEDIRKVMVHALYSGVVALPPEFLKARGLCRGKKVRIFWGKRGVLILPVEDPVGPEEREIFRKVVDGEP